MSRSYAEIKAELDAAEAGVLDELAAAKEADRGDKSTEATRARRKAAVESAVALRASQREGRVGMSVTATGGDGEVIAPVAEPALEG